MDKLFAAVYAAFVLLVGVGCMPVTGGTNPPGAQIMVRAGGCPGTLTLEGFNYKMTGLHDRDCINLEHPFLSWYALTICEATNYSAMSFVRDWKPGSEGCNRVVATVVAPD